MACKIGQIAIGHIGQINGCFTKVPPCVRARLKLCGNGVTSVQSVLFCFRVLSLHIGQIFCNMHHITDVAHYPQTDSASDARLALHHAGGFPCACSIASPWVRYAPSRGLPAMRACMLIVRFMVMPCCCLVAWCDAYARPACRRIPAWIPANHWAIVRAGIERRSSAQGGHRQAHDSGGVPRQDLRVCRGTPLANNFIFFCYTRA